MKSARNNNHATSACVGCRKRKTKCDEVHPVCSPCAKKGRECEWTPDSDRRTARGRKCEDCAVWRVKCAELEARIAVLDGCPERNLGLSSAERTRQPLHAAPDLGPPQPATGLNAEEQRCFQAALFPLDDEPSAGAHSEPTALGGNIGATYWLSANSSTLFPDAETYAEFDGLYGYPSVTTAPSLFLDGVFDSSVGPESATEHAQP